MHAWLQEFSELMFGENRSRASMEKAACLKYENMPTILYKYRYADDRSITAYKDDCVYSAPVTTFNDFNEAPILVSDRAKALSLTREYLKIREEEYPFLPLCNPQNEEEFIAAIREGFKPKGYSLGFWDIQFENQLATMMKKVTYPMIKSIQKRARMLYNIYCLTTRYDNPVMWANYGDNSRGFCIGYGIKELGIKNTLVQCTLPVIYGKTDDVHSVLIDDLDEEQGSIAMYASINKQKIWSYEDEWRIFYQATFENGQIHECGRRESFPYAKTVYLGARIDQKRKQEILNICQEKKIKVYQMMHDEEKYQNFTVPVNN